MIAGMNGGRIRVLFGSTEMLGTGVNAQQRAVALHHLDSPWRPSDLEQREGRAVRRDNEVARDFAGRKRKKHHRLQTFVRPLYALLYISLQNKNRFLNLFNIF
jgi:SNF2 family DNA or RNA helicase